MKFNKQQINYRDDFIVENKQKINLDKFDNLNNLFDYTFENYANKHAFINLSKRLKFKHIDKYSKRFAAYLLNHTDLRPGDKVVLQMPNILTYPIAAIGILRAGMIVVNANPLYTERELEHQLNDSEAKAIVAFVGAAQKIQHILPRTKIKHVILTNVADMHPMLKRRLINWAVINLKKSVPDYDLPYAVSFRKALKLGKGEDFVSPKTNKNSIACLQYTGGTTGVAKGAILTHENLLSNLLQIENIIQGSFDNVENPVLVSPLPLYHIYSFTISFLVTMYSGFSSLLITDPRDVQTFNKTLSKTPFHAMVGINTLFNLLLNDEDFNKLDFSNMVLTISGGMALTSSVAEKWKKLTQISILEGYGMSETSPLILANPIDDTKVGSIGYPIADTKVKLVDDAGQILDYGQTGELCVKGSQVMQGYWNNDEETKKVLDADGFLHTGDICVVDENKRFKIVDRKKDMIIVSGFNVYPNEIEDVLALHPDVLEVAVIGVPDKKSGEAVKAFIATREGKFLDSKDLKNWCKERLTAYKRPSFYEFRRELPKSAVGKVLRKELRNNQ